MSVRAFGWAWEQKGLSPEQRCVLLFLAEKHDRKTGLCDPGQSTIAEAVEISVYSVRKALTELEAKNMFVRVRRARKGDGSQRGRWTDRFILGCDQDAILAHWSADQDSTEPGPRCEADPPTSENAPRTGNTLEPFCSKEQVATKAPPDTRVHRLNGKYITEHQASFGARPRDADRMGREIKTAFSAGWSESAVESAVLLAARDPFGASALARILKDQSSTSSFDADWNEVTQAVAAGRGRTALSSARARDAWTEVFGPVDGRYVDLTPWNKTRFQQAWRNG